MTGKSCAWGLRGGWLAMLLLVGVAGCRRPDPEPAVEVTYGAFVGSLTDPLALARLDVGVSALVSSYDPAGGNNDFNNFQGREGGWAVLADLAGPGVVTRFWTTGGQSADQRLRFFFDDEAEPRIDATVRELRAGLGLLTAPLSRYEQSCWWTYAPITFRKRLRILAEHDNFTHEGWPRLFYQVNWSRLTAQHPPSFPVPGTPEDVAALAALAAGWEEGRGEVLGGGLEGVPSFTLSIPAGGVQELPALKGPAVIHQLLLDLPDEGAGALLDLQMFWDGEGAPSVDTPLEAFFGGIWQRIDYRSKFMATEGLRRVSRLPMPFARSARIVLVNRGAVAVAVTGRVWSEPLPAWDRGLGYLHAVWHHSTPGDRGRPHRVARAQGRGKFVGCVLGVSSAVPSWWVLEADETMTADGATVPAWRGTGLEDYFNGAWYYKNNLTRPLHGLILKRPYVTVQYRFHERDAFGFDRALDMVFERGPGQDSPAWMESTGYYYSDKPRPAGSDGVSARTGGAPGDPFEQAALMTTLANYERQGDDAGADACVADFLTRFPEVPYAGILRLRRLAYRERLEGYAAVEADYLAFLQRAQDPAARAYARMLTWVHEDPSHGLLSLFCGGPAEAFLDGQSVAQAGNPAAFVVVPVKLEPGAHVLSVRAARAAYPAWVQACLRTRDGMIMTTPAWACSFTPGAGFERAGFDDRAWLRTGDSLHEGPPPAPYIQTSPHPFVGMQALPSAIWAATEWPPEAESVVFRWEFTVGGEGRDAGLPSATGAAE